ncbi:MAG: D-alanine--D-alanine ligase [Nitrospirae bacterium]|nr:MAG: D-alanine--D-alanine ligase [Nitrospirota bacterium]
MTIGLVYDLRAAYRDQDLSVEALAEFDSEETVEALEAALRGIGHRPERIGHGRDLARRLVGGERWDLVFNIAEGVAGRSREAQVPALLELFDLPYTFSDPLTCAATLDKGVAKRLVAAAGVATAPFAVVHDLAELDRLELAYPLFAKPLAEGTGKGVDGDSRVRNEAALRPVVARLLERYRQPVLVEEYLPGREFTTSILGTGAAARVLGTLEVILSADAPHDDYTFAVKEESERYVDYLPLYEPPLRRAVESLALTAYCALECRDAGRVDVRLDRHGRPCFLELNPLPGLHPTHSDLPMTATAHGMAYDELIGAIVASACGRHGIDHGA